MVVVYQEAGPVLLHLEQDILMNNEFFIIAVSSKGKCQDNNVTHKSFYQRLVKE